jgi:hypothetical protein
VRLRAVNPSPLQVFTIPANFDAHIGELGDRAITPADQSGADARFFLKATGSISGRDEAILLPYGSQRRFDHEWQLGVVIGADGTISESTPCGCNATGQAGTRRSSWNWSAITRLPLASPRACSMWLSRGDRSMAGAWRRPSALS